ncbi:uncharacterized protein LOC124329334 [Daphnia pulicaria]|uniref:uncharacterized protein LOC124329334 n=1 Tax=Daphnia pulicaria TaxID=35523 RepID=UPI001EEC8B5B|nr:uncharacterized protein LOC124329334 [Daphnia pulicaria]
MFDKIIFLLFVASVVFSNPMNEAEKIDELKKLERCSLPPVKPNSFICSLTITPSWTYDAKAGECLSYQYGGCGKTTNLFGSQDECKAACSRGPAKEKSLQELCWYRNVSYYAGQEIAQVNKDDACKTDCFCEKSDNHRGGATIKCNQIVCDELIPPQEEGCVLVTLPGACCPSYKCPERSLDQEGTPDDICVFNGKGYLKGQAIPSGDPCKRCVCVDGFSGLNSPGCHEVHCILDNRIGCNPVYTPGVCCPTSYRCNSPMAKFFPQIDSDLSRIKWGHGINSKVQLNTSLYGKDMMIEADVSMGTIVGGDGSILPIMAHPPLVSSDLSLEEFMDTILNSGTFKGIKLDFKDIEALEPSLMAIKSRASKITAPLWLNADILAGPVNATTKPVDIGRFLDLTKSYFPDSVLSVGWTTRFGPQMTWPLQIINEGSYTMDHMIQMRDALHAAQIRQPVTFPIRAGLSTSPESQRNILWLLEQIENSSLTVWSSQYDIVDVPALMKLVNHIGKENIFVDVPSGLSCEIQHFEE